MAELFTIDKKILNAAAEARRLCGPVFERFEETAQQNSQKVLAAFIHNRVAEADFGGSSGYGYGDAGREKLDRVFAEAFGAEDALARHNFISGTHAIATALFGLLRPGNLLLGCTGSPYDTLEEVIGLRGEGEGSLKDFGVAFQAVPLTPQGTPDLPAIAKAAAKHPRAAYIQRSRGYSLRPSLPVAKIAEIARAVKAVSPETCVVVDNCYGEFVETLEPTACGADLIIGSLIKNPGGGIAETGGYIAGRKDLVELCGYRLATPGTGREAGPTLNQLRNLFRGIYLAPHITMQALKTASFASALFHLLGFEATPAFDEPRTDIIESVKLGSPEALIAFCQGIQKGSPVDSFAAPEPWDMPGYGCKVIMAAGAFVMGSSIELSADAPLREPYAVWMQGGLTFETGKLGVLCAAQELLERGLL